MLMEKRSFATSFGPLNVWGAFTQFSPHRPLLFVARGAFASEAQLLGLASAFTAVDVAYVHLPGQHTPFFQKDRILDFAAAYDEVIAQLGHRRAGIVGISLGGIVAMAMRSPAIEALLLVDPPLSTAPVWVLPPLFRPRIRDDPRLALWIWNLFGISETEVVNRDYRPLLADLAAPAVVLIGGEALGAPRPVTRAPSAVCDDDRTLYETCSRIQTEFVPGVGHNIPKDGTAAFVRAVRHLIATYG